MNNELKIFEGHEVEVIEFNGQVLFNASHVANVLEIKNVRENLRNMNDNQVVLLKNSAVSKTDTRKPTNSKVTISNFRKLNNAGENFLTESGVYKLVFKSHKPNAEAFSDWIADEVLPTLRQDGSYEMPKQEKPKKKNLSAANMLIKNVTDIFTKAGVNPLFIATEAKRLYKEQADVEIKIPLVTDKEDMPKLYDCTEIAKELGILSTSGKLHNQAVSAILSKLDIEESEIVKTAFSRNGHDDVTTQYKPSVYAKVENWLEENSYPSKIPYTDSKGNYKTYSVVYQEVA